MKKIIAMAGLAAMTVGCQPAATPPSVVPVSSGHAAAVLSNRILPDSAIVKIAARCEKYGGLLRYASLPVMPDIVRESAQDAAAYCDQLVVPPGRVLDEAKPVPPEVVRAVVLPPTTDGNTPSWMDRVLSGLKTAAAIARVALPGI